MQINDKKFIQVVEICFLHRIFFSFIFCKFHKISYYWKFIHFPDEPQSECQQCNSNESQTPSNSTINCNLNDVETKLFGRNPHICDSSNGQHKHQCFELIQQKSDEVELSDHIQFLITEVSAPAAPSIQEKEPPDDVDVLTEGNIFVMKN